MTFLMEILEKVHRFLKKSALDLVIKYAEDIR
jgi:hypothetical protein